MLFLLHWCKHCIINSVVLVNKLRYLYLLDTQSHTWLLEKHKNICFLPICFTEAYLYIYVFTYRNIERLFSKPLKIFFESIYLNNWLVKLTEADHSVHINMLTRNTLFKEKINIAYISGGSPKQHLSKKA